MKYIIRIIILSIYFIFITIILIKQVNALGPPLQFPSGPDLTKTMNECWAMSNHHFSPYDKLTNPLNDSSAMEMSRKRRQLRNRKARRSYRKNHKKLRFV